MDGQVSDNKWIGKRTIRPDGADKVTGHALCSAPGSLDTSLSHAAGLIEIAACHA